MSKKEQKIITKSKNKNLNPFVITLLILLVIYSFTFIFAIYFGILTSLKTPQEYMYGDPFAGNPPNILGFPNISLNKKFASIDGTVYNIFNNYKYVLDSFKFIPDSVSYFTMFGTQVEHVGKQVGILDYLFNTLMYCGICPLLTVLCSSVSGFLCCKYKYKYSGFLYTLLLITMTIPVVGSQPATLTMLQKAGLYDTYLSMIVQNMHFGGIHFFVFYAFFQGLSDTYIEAAEIDGASQFSTLIKIVIPLAWKTMLTVYIIMFVALWNTYEAPMLYYPTKPTLAYGIYWMANSTTNTNVITQSAPVKIAGCMTLCIPTLIIFLCLKDVMMGNLTLGGLKE